MHKVELVVMVDGVPQRTVDVTKRVNDLYDRVEALEGEPNKYIRDTNGLAKMADIAFTSEPALDAIINTYPQDLGFTIWNLALLDEESASN